MNAISTCPICKFENVPPDQERCPQCDAQLTCFRILEALPDTAQPAADTKQAVAPAPPPPMPPPAAPRRSLFWGSLLGSMVIILMGLQLYLILRLSAGNNDRRTLMARGFNSVSQQLQQLRTQQERQPASMQEALDTHLDQLLKRQRVGFEQMTARLDQLPGAIANGLRGQPAGRTSTATDVSSGGGKADTARETRASSAATGELLAAVPQPESDRKADVASYRIGRADTLWRLARKFYGAGHYYPVILEHNPHLAIYDIEAGQRIRYPTDRQLARQLYRRITVVKAGRQYWFYTVRSGDTTASIKRRYCPRSTCLAPLAAADLQPGRKIKILLAGR